MTTFLNPLFKVSQNGEINEETVTRASSSLTNLLNTMEKNGKAVRHELNVYDDAKVTLDHNIWYLYETETGVIAMKVVYRTSTWTGMQVIDM